MRDFLIYVQVPFCPSKCHFCGWVSHIPVRDLRLREQDEPRSAYVRALQQQIRHVAPRLRDQGYVPRLMYWGGGTASMFSIREFTTVMDTLKEEFDLGGIVEATMESSPDTLTAEKLAAYRAAGFNRISVGVQSLDDERLAKEGRSHRSAHAREAVRLANEAGFGQINVDLMCGLPGETLAEFHGSARAVVELPITHISLYPYTPAPGSVMHKQIARGQVRMDRAEQKKAYAVGRQLFENAGFPEYAMSYFGRQPCLADLAYYRLDMDFAGFGAGAASLLDRESLVTHKPLATYIADPTGYAERQPAADQSVRYLFGQSLSLFEGADAQRWEERLGVPLDTVLSTEPVVEYIEHLEKSAGLIRDERGIRLPRERIANTFIDTIWVHVPTTA